MFRSNDSIEVKGIEPNTNVNVGVFDDHIMMSIWIGRAHCGLDLTPQKAKQLIEAIQANLDYLQSTEEA